MTDSPPALFDVPASPRSCWYCGSNDGPFEREHQLPVSRGGGGGLNVVWACASCNDIKGHCTPEQYREGLAERLGLPPVNVTFAGEATLDRPMTAAILSIHSLEGDRAVVRIAPQAKEQLEQAWSYLRGALQPGLTQRDLATTAITNYLNELRVRYALGDRWPNPTPALFDQPHDLDEGRLVTGRRELARTPKVLQHREKTSVSGDLLDWARAGVEYRRAHGEPHIQLVEWMNAAVLAALQDEAGRASDFPSLSEALDQRYGADHQSSQLG